ncbi:MAG: histidinol-phosphate transaminase [Pacificimonas sp.]|jgi:histidinol-phosphate aminotransferase|nr:histidinol-phosphate transaminase [Pacificimonas sp.]
MNPWIEAISPYVPGRSGDPGVRTVKLSSNENPLGASPQALRAMAAAVNRPHRYPDAAAHELRGAIAEAHGIEADRIVCGTGSDELLQCLALAYAGPGDEVIHMRYGFMVYPMAARRAGAVPIAVEDKDYGADVDAILDAVTERTKLVYLANPNNPTGTLAPADEIRRLHTDLPPHIMLVLDAAYAEYIDPDMDYEDGIAMAREHANVVTTRTFSKIYGLAGARVGWAYGQPEVIGALNRIRGPFNVTTEAQAAAMAAVRDTAWLKHCREDNAKERARLVSALEALGNYGVRAVPSEANFVLTVFPDDKDRNAEAANDFLSARNILVRWLPKMGLGHTLRLGVGTAEENDELIAALRAFFGEG